MRNMLYILAYLAILIIGFGGIGAALAVFDHPSFSGEECLAVWGAAACALGTILASYKLSVLHRVLGKHLGKNKSNG
jgi:hypothetical protein